MSLGFIEDNTEVDPPTVEFEIGKPSITISGSFDAPKEDPPLILIVDPPPGAPSETMSTPATRP